MPSSRASTIPYVISVIIQLKPDSILDVGTGFGKWGYLFREYTDIRLSERDLSRYRKENWRVRIDGIEAFPQYLCEPHRFIYNNIFIGLVEDVMVDCEEYDVIFFGDVIEHLAKDRGEAVLRTALAKARKGVLVTTPARETRQGELCGNPLESHRSLWRRKDFRRIAPGKVRFADCETLVVFFPRGAADARLELLHGAPGFQCGLGRVIRRVGGVLAKAYRRAL